MVIRPILGIVGIFGMGRLTPLTGCIVAEVLSCLDRYADGLPNIFECSERCLNPKRFKTEAVRISTVHIELSFKCHRDSTSPQLSGLHA